jgi:glycosyltransferase 2 family protein
MPTTSPNSGSTERRMPAVSRRTILVGLAAGVPVSVLLMVVALRNTDAHELGRSLRGADPAMLVPALGAMALVYLTQALRWKLISDVPLPLSRFLEWVVGGVAVNNVVPGRAGDLVRIEWLSRGARSSRARSSASVVVDRGSDVLVLALLLAATYPSMPHTPWLRLLGLGGLVLFLAVAAVFAGACIWARRPEAASGSKVVVFLDGLARSIGAALGARRAAAILAVSALAWCAWAVGAELVARSLGIHLAVHEVLFVTAVVNLGVAIPSSPGFVGTYQWLAVSALGLLGVGHVPAFAFSVVMHALWFVPTTVAGALLAARKAPLVIARPLSEKHAA